VTAEARRRKPADIVIAVIGIVAAIWVTYWYLANQMAFLAIDRVIDGAAKHGNIVACSPKVSRGFPLTLDVGCGGLRLADGDGGVSIASPGFSAKTPLYWPLRLTVSAAAPVSVKPPADGTGMTANWTNASAHVEAGLRGLYGGTAELDNFVLGGPIDIPHLPLAVLKAGKARFSLAPVPAKPGDYGLSVSLDGIAPQSADARVLPEISATAHLTAFAIGKSLGLDPKRTFAAWAAKGGKANLEAARLAIGPIVVNASGPLAVSPEGLLSGKVTVRFVNLEQLPAIIEALQPGSRSAAAFAKLLMVVTKKVDTESGPARETVLNLSNGSLFFGIVPIGTIPPLL
jgi:hypothetical protein